MNPSCIRQTELPHTTKLFADFTYHRDRVARFYPYLPLGGKTWAETASAIDFPAERRAALIEALHVQNAENPLLAELAKPGVVAVVTGQQVGLFSGPAYTIYKALTAVKLARELTAQGIAAVPVFWLATEDHDFAEVNQAWFFGPDHQPKKLDAVVARQSEQPAGSAVIEEVPLDEAARILEGLPFAAEAVGMLRECYRPGMTFGAAFAELTERLLDGFPLLRLDPMLPEFRKLAAPLLRAAVEAAPELTEELLARGRELVDAGYHAQVHVEPTTSLVFLLEQGRRLALRRHNGKYQAGAETFTAEELAARAQDLSPNALLRPVAQDWMLPTVAYVGGPAEISYLAQSEVLYRRLLGRQSVAVHRAGFTVTGPRSHKLMARLHLRLQDFLRLDGALREKAGEALVDPGMLSRIGKARADAEASLNAMAADLVKFDPSIAKALETSRRKIAYQFGKIERKAAREALLRDERAGQGVASTSGLVFPNKHLQERLYSMIPLYAKHGPDLVKIVYDAIQLDCPDHQVLTVG